MTPHPYIPLTRANSYPSMDEGWSPSPTDPSIFVMNDDAQAEDLPYVRLMADHDVVAAGMVTIALVTPSDDGGCLEVDLTAEDARLLADQPLRCAEAAEQPVALGGEP